jgi:hypothetical protein
VSIGGKDVMPKHSTARVIGTEEPKEIVLLNLGRMQKVTQNDTFIVHYSGFRIWELVVTEVFENYTHARIVCKKGKGVRQFPPIGAYAKLKCN